MVMLLLDRFSGVFGKYSSVFGYYSTRMMLAALTSLVICIFLGPRLIKKLYELRIGQTIRKEECLPLYQLHEKKKDTPTMGGALILFSMLISMLLWMDITHIFTLILFFTTLVFGCLGAYDDYLKLKYRNSKGLPGRYKMLIQIVFAGLLGLYLFVPAISEWVAIGDWFQAPIVKEQTQVISLQDYASRLYVPFMKEPLLQFSGLALLLGILFIIIVVTGSSNGVNLTDGLDGLAAGCLVMVALCLAFFAFVSNHVGIAAYLNILYIEGSGEIAIYLCAFAGACLGFLWYNGHPAQVFMGDTGSLALGGIIGVSAVLLKREILLALIGGIFVAEALSVIIQVTSYRYRNKKRVFLCSPLHHHFEYAGWPETKVVIRFWIVGLLLAILGLASLKFQ